MFYYMRGDLPVHERPNPISKSYGQTKMQKKREEKTCNNNETDCANEKCIHAVEAHTRQQHSIHDYYYQIIIVLYLRCALCSLSHCHLLLFCGSG